MGKGQNPSSRGLNPTTLNLTLQEPFTPLSVFVQQTIIDKHAEICHPGEKNTALVLHILILPKFSNHNATLTEKHNQWKLTENITAFWETRIFPVIHMVK